MVSVRCPLFFLICASVGCAPPVSRPTLPTPLPTPRAALRPPRVTETLSYRELFTGFLPGKTHIATWSMELRGDGGLTIVKTRASAPMNSLIVGRAKPLGAVIVSASTSLEGTWEEKGDDVTFHLASGALRCARTQVKALAAGALLVVTRGDDEDVGHGAWRPPDRTEVLVLACAREGLASPPSWQEEPQPDRLLFAPLPGVEYAHDNDDMVVQMGGVRRVALP